jgi:hypothetical protein
MKNLEQSNYSSALAVRDLKAKYEEYLECNKS